MRSNALYVYQYAANDGATFSQNARTENVRCFFYDYGDDGAAGDVSRTQRQQYARIAYTHRGFVHLHSYAAFARAHRGRAAAKRCNAAYTNTRA